MERRTPGEGTLALVGGVVSLLALVGLMVAATVHDSAQGGVGAALSAACWVGLVAGIGLVAIAVVRSSR